MDILIHRGAVLPLDHTLPPIMDPGYVAIEGGRIASLGPGNPP